MLISMNPMAKLARVQELLMDHMVCIVLVRVVAVGFYINDELLWIG